MVTFFIGHEFVCHYYFDIYFKKHYDVLPKVFISSPTLYHSLILLRKVVCLQLLVLLLVVLCATPPEFKLHLIAIIKMCAAAEV